MKDVQESILKAIRSLLDPERQAEVEVAADVPLHADGLGLDSLQMAELSALLEDEFGSDPFSAGLMPETGAEIAAFYVEDGQSGTPVPA